jgi:hypothetical protein
MVLIPRPQPKLMVIGDSLAQGCRSLTVGRTFCEQAWPARLAQTQGWEFVAPDFPRPVLFDLETEVRRLDTLTFTFANLRFEGFETRFRANLGDWLAGGVESAFPCFDNLALSGALIHDLYSRTAASSATEVASLTPLGASSAISLQSVGDLHVALNGRFVLNPARDPVFDGFTALDWVRERKPERVIVQIGHNHGLYEVGSRAAVVNIDGSHAAHGTYWDQWGRLADELAQFPPEVGSVIVTLLPKVGAVANLRAQGVNRTSGYADTYEPVFAPSVGVLSGEELAAVDARIRAANDRIRSIVTTAATTAGTAGRVKFLDMYALFDGFDYKNSLNPARRIDLGDGVVVDNRYLEAATERRHWFSPATRRWIAGGLQSIDGMHPTGCGYALLASEVMNALGGLPHDRVALLRQGFMEDSLLSNIPGELSILVRLLSVLRELDRLNQFIADRSTFLTDQLHLTDALRFMRQVFIR